MSVSLGLCLASALDAPGVGSASSGNGKVMSGVSVSVAVACRWAASVISVRHCEDQVAANSAHLMRVSLALASTAVCSRSGSSARRWGCKSSSHVISSVMCWAHRGCRLARRVRFNTTVGAWLKSLGRYRRRLRRNVVHSEWACGCRARLNMSFVMLCC